MPVAVALAQALKPWRDDPAGSGILLDVDGTLAPIVPRPEDAAVPAATRDVLRGLAATYGLVACVSGRGAVHAREMVGLDALAYIGAHGAEHLAPGAAAAVTDPAAAEWAPMVQRFAAQEFEHLAPQGIRSEDKDFIVALHWRDAGDGVAAETALAAVASRATDAGLGVHWGRKVLEVRPPVPIDKGRGITTLLRETAIDRALYVGDDRTDIDGFSGLRVLAADGRLTHTLSVGVASDETPPELVEAADVIVNGTDGVLRLLRALA